MSPVPENLLKEDSNTVVDGGNIMLPLFIALAVVMAALFVGEMLFGKNSLEVYLALQKDEVVLQRKIYRLKKENATLQKKYFEIKNIMPTEEDE